MKLSSPLITRFIASAFFLFYSSYSYLQAQKTSNIHQKKVSSLLDHSFEWISNDTINIALDGFPKFKIKVKNNGTNRSPDRLGVSFISNDYDGVIGGFANFPNGGHIKLEPGDSTIVSIWSQGVKERPINDKDANDIFSRDIGFKFRVDDFNNPQEHIVRKTIKFMDWERPVRLEKINGSMQISGIIPADLNSTSISGNTSQETKVYIRTPYAQELIEISRGPANQSLSFQANILPRNDWYLVVDQPSYVRSVTHITPENATNIQINRKEAGIIIPKYELHHVINTPTGFWRGAISESEQSFVVFPGQENWKAENTTVLKQNSTIYKMNFEGTQIWSHETGWEVWGGDMTSDGKWVSYIVNPAPGPKEHKMVILNGETGNVHWEIKTTADEAYSATGRILESVAIELSDDGTFVAFGTSAGGQVTLANVQNKEILWSFPDETYPYTTGFGQVREMRFSDDNQYLYIGSGDSYLFKLRLSDKKILWKKYIAAWPFVNGMNFSPDKKYIYTGTKAYELSKIDAATGELIWQIEPQKFDAEVSRDGKYVATFGGLLFETETGQFLGSGKDRTHVLNGEKFTIGVNKEITTYDFGGKVWNVSEQSGIGDCAGCQVQWSYLSLDEQYVIVSARDMTESFPTPGPGIAIYKRVAGTNLSVDDELNRLPKQIELKQNYPNPFNSKTAIDFSLPFDAEVKIEVFSLLGQSVSVILNEKRSAGLHTIEFDAAGLATGMYIYRLTTPTFSISKKMNLLK